MANFLMIFCIQKWMNGLNLLNPKTKTILDSSLDFYVYAMKTQIILFFLEKPISQTENNVLKIFQNEKETYYSYPP